jgi:hypothetical protein
MVSTSNRGLWGQIKYKFPISQNIQPKQFIKELTRITEPFAIFTAFKNE